ncbi:MAG: YidC/Oxa1 family membrane protein insertase [Bacilli bacterium]
MHKSKKIILVLLAVFVLTGCTKYKEYEKKPVIIEQTGQRVVENVLCKTDKTAEELNKIKVKNIELLTKQLENKEITQEELNKKFEELNKTFNVDNIVSCSEFKVNSNKEGLFTTLFVNTLAWLIIKVGEFTKNYGWAIIIVTILIRLVMYPLTKKTALQSEGLKEAKPKLDKLEAKYRNRTDQEAQMMKSQEMMKIYKDYKINPMSGCLFALIQIPLFFAFYEALYRLPVVLEENFLGINLGLTPLTAFKAGHYYYAIFIILVIAATYFSFKLNAADTGGQSQKQMKMMTNMSIIMISIASFTISTGIALYWIINSSFTIVQNLLVKRRKKNDHVA